MDCSQRHVTEASRQTTGVTFGFSKNIANKLINCNRRMKSGKCIVLELMGLARAFSVVHGM